MTDLVAGVGQERGEDLRVDVVFNDRRRIHLPATPDRMPTPSQLAAARQRSVVRWERPLDNYDHTVFFHVNDVPDAFDYQMCADTHHISPADMESMARCVEDVFLAAAFDGTSRTGC